MLDIKFSSTARDECTNLMKIVNWCDDNIPNIRFVLSDLPPRYSITEFSKYTVIANLAWGGWGLNKVFRIRFVFETIEDKTLFDLTWG
jgi:hypothetical protein